MIATSPTPPISSHDLARRILDQPDMPVVVSAAFPGREVADPDAPELSVHTTWDAAALDERGRPGGEGLRTLVIYPARSFDEHLRSMGVDPGGIIDGASIDSPGQLG